MTTAGAFAALCRADAAVALAFDDAVTLEQRLLPSGRSRYAAPPGGLADPR